MFREHFLTIAERDLWSRYLPPSRSVFGSLGYARICDTFRNGSPRLYVVELGEATICYPMLLRPLSNLPFTVSTEGRYDSTTPDFTGPIMFGSDQLLADSFSSLRDTLFRRHGVVAEFAHLHPWSESMDLLPEGCEYNREIVWIDVSLGPDQLWSTHFEHACRKNINRAQQAGVKVYAASSDEYLREFCRIYDDTMQRNQALASYYFPFDFFKAVRDELPENSRFVFAEYRDQIVAATLYLHDDNDVFSFLGGADASFQQVRPTNAVIWDSIRWAHGAGKKRFVLGGGYKPDDGIFRFKATFSPLRRSFYIYKRIHLEQDYETLNRRCREHNGPDSEPAGSFPSYRFLCNANPARS
jgi:serine/alanine adding enzyme